MSVVEPHVSQEAIPTDLPVVPPPWALTGDGYVFFYRFAPGFAESSGWISDDLRPYYRGGVGAVAFMDYRTSGVGAYRELLFIPGRFEFSGAGKKHFSITHIYVESMMSVVSGRANWGIPKYRADFDRYLDDATNIEILAASLNGHEFARLSVVQKLLKLPVNTNLCPVTLMQPGEDGTLIATALRMKASVSLLDVAAVNIDNAYFPDVGGQTPLGAVKLGDFQITFPTPEYRATT